MSPTTGSSKKKPNTENVEGRVYKGPVAFGEDGFHHPVRDVEHEDGIRHELVPEIRLITDADDDPDNDPDTDDVVYRVAGADAVPHNERYGTGNVADLEVGGGA